MSIQESRENGTLKLKILDGIPVSLPAIQVIGLLGDLDNAGDAVVDVVVAFVVVVVFLVVVVGAEVVERLADDFPRIYFWRLKGFLFLSLLCLACP